MTESPTADAPQPPESDARPAVSAAAAHPARSVRVLGLVAAGVLAVSGVLALASTFASLKQLSVDIPAGGIRQTFTITIGVWGSWSHRTAGATGQATDDGQVLQFGLPLIVGAILLIGCAVAMPVVRGNVRRAVIRPVALGGVGIMVGAAWCVYVYLTGFYDNDNLGMVHATYGAGWTVMLTATGMGLLGAVLTLISARGETPAPGPTGTGVPTALGRGVVASVRTADESVVAYAIEPETPRHGIPALGEGPPEDGWGADRDGPSPA